MYTSDAHSLDTLWVRFKPLLLHIHWYSHSNFKSGIQVWYDCTFTGLHQSLYIFTGIQVCQFLCRAMLYMRDNRTISRTLILHGAVSN